MLNLKSNKMVDFINENEKEINEIIDNEFGGRVTPRELQQIAMGLMEKMENDVPVTATKGETKEIVFSDENIARIETERLETIQMIWGK